MSSDYIPSQNLSTKFQNILKIRGYKTNGYEGSSLKHSSTDSMTPDYLISSSRIDSNIKLLEERLKEFQKSNNSIEKASQSASLYNSKEEKLNEMIENIKEGISNIQSSMQNLSQLKSEMNYSKDSAKISLAIEQTLQSRFYNLTKNFKSSLQSRTEVIKKFQEKKSKLHIQNANSIIKNRNTPMFLKKKVEDTHENKVGHQSILIEDDTTNLQERNQSLTNIEKTLHEVSSLFARIGQIAQIHQVMIDRIDTESSTALLNMEGGRKNLMEYYKNVSSNRSLILKVFFILFLFAIVYIMFLI